MNAAQLTSRREARESTRVDAAHARSWQLVNALHDDDFDAAQLGRSDAVILDLEDAIDDTQKDAARAKVVDWLTDGGRAWVRINSVDTEFWGADIAALTSLRGLAGVVLAKVESAAEVSTTHDRLGAGTPVIALVESALGVERATEIACAPGAFRLAFGGGDYRKDIGAENTPLAMAYPRTRLVIASRIAGLTGPIDTPTVSSTHAVIRQQCGDGVALGMTGKLCLDGEQPAIINESMSPSSSDVAWAEDFMAGFRAGGGIIRDGSYKPRLARAAMIQRRAEIFRIPAPTPAP